MKKVIKIDAIERIFEDKKRVAAYCRVSTDTYDQLQSLENQKEHYERYIGGNSEWAYAGIYFDEGLSGTKKESREGLKSLINDCEKGLIDLIITKSISRFSRNTADCLELVRKLQNYEVDIFFEKENIHTGSMESELMLSILASLAQDESRSISENSKWAVRKRFQNGTFIIGYPPYGFENVDGKLVINEEQAKVVRKIFEDTIAGKGTCSIAKELNADKVPTKRGGKWSDGTLLDMIQNEKYVGDIRYQKTFTDENFDRYKNRGEVEQYYYKNSHKAIISRADFELANEILNQRRLEKNIERSSRKYQKTYPFSRRIICGECGANFVRRTHTKVGGKYIAWACSNHLYDKETCSMLYINDEDIKYAFTTLINKLIFSKKEILEPFLESLTLQNKMPDHDEIKEVNKKIDENINQRQMVNTLFTDFVLDQTIYFKTNNQLLLEYDNLKSRREQTLKLNEDGNLMEENLRLLIHSLEKMKYIKDFDKYLFESFVEKIVVSKRDEVIFEMKCGLKLKERLS